MKRYAPIYTLLENGAIALAALFSGVMAGFFYTYTYNINLAMLQVDGETYAIMQSLFNENVRHPMFFVFFFGAAAIGIVAVLINWRHHQSPMFWLIAGAAALYIAGIVIFTSSVNLPLNTYTESWNPAALPVDWENTRDAWNQANASRVGVSVTVFASYLIVLVMRATGKQRIND